MPKRVTIKTIAEELGVSHMTVSRALSNHPNVLAETKEAILRHATARGYVKSAAATALRGDGTRIVGLLLPNLVNEFYARFANALAIACEQTSLQLIIHLTNDDPLAEARAIARLIEVQAFAVLMVPTPEGIRHSIPDLTGLRIVQLIREKAISQPCVSITIDDGSAIAEAIAVLANKGHRRIAYIGADAALSSGRLRLQAFRQAMDACGLAVDPALLATAPPSFEMGRQSAARLLRQKEASALLCGGVEISNGALSAFMEIAAADRAGLAFFGYGDPLFYRWIEGGLSTISIDAEALATAAADILRHPASGEQALLRLKATLTLRKVPEPKDR